jgi:tetratricopeptide (TPR) repeat protein
MQKAMQKSLLNNIIMLAFSLIGVLGTMPVLSQMADEQYMAGCAYYLKGDFSGAVQSYSLAIMHNNADEQLYMKRGAAYLKNKDTEKALADFNEANLINPGIADLWLARAYAISNDQVQAIIYLKKHLNSPFRLPEDSIKKDKLFDNLQVTPEWHSLWQQDWYNPTEKIAAEANYYANRKQYDKALALLDDEMAKSPMDASLTFLRGKINFEQGLYAPAIADLTAALNQDKSIASGYSMRGMAYLKAGRFKDAIYDFNKALKDEPGDFDLYIWRAEAFAGQKTWSSAIRDVSTYMKYFDEDIQARYRCGEYHYQAGDYINALKYFNQIMKEEPDNSLFFKARGKTYLKTATYRYAISDLAMSLDLNPGDAETWMYLGIAKIKSGDQQNGCSDLERARKMGDAEALQFIVDYCK